MKPFTYIRASTADQAIAQMEVRRESSYLGGGTNLIDLMKMGVEQPSRLVDVTRLALASIEEWRGGLRIGAMVRNSALAADPLIRERYPILSQAVLAGASPQIRNMATVGGNLLQRTRCNYFYDPSYAECNKRAPGSGCAALQGYNRNHAILGASEHCVATHPSDMAVALAVLDATVQVKGPRGERSIPFASLYRLPGDTPQIETALQPGELITWIDLPSTSMRKSHYLKVRDRNSFAFALVSVAAVVDIDSSNRIRDARFALGGVAAHPWRVPEAEVALRGAGLNDERVYRAAADIALRGAKPLTGNGFKIELARRAISRACSQAAESA
jgi:xanthine dehydrogenase YagS FAD-binding subunit